MTAQIVGCMPIDCLHCGARYSVVFHEIGRVSEPDKFICRQCKQIMLEWGGPHGDQRSYADFRLLG